MHSELHILNRWRAVEYEFKENIDDEAALIRFGYSQRDITWLYSSIACLGCRRHKDISEFKQPRAAQFMLVHPFYAQPTTPRVFDEYQRPSLAGLNDRSLCELCYPYIEFSWSPNDRVCMLIERNAEREWAAKVHGDDWLCELCWESTRTTDGPGYELYDFDPTLLVPGLCRGCWDIFVRDFTGLVTQRASQGMYDDLLDRYGKRLGEACDYSRVRDSQSCRSEWVWPW